MTIKTFAPNPAINTAQLSASATSSRVALDQFSAAVRVLNAGPDLAYIHFGGAAVAADNAKMPIPVGSIELFTKANATHVAAICDATKTATLYFTSGEGI